MAISASLDPIAYVLRLHPDGGYGSPYIGSATIIRTGDTAEIQGMTVEGRFTAGHWRAVVDALRAVGIRLMVFDRRDGGEVRRREVRI